MCLALDHTRSRILRLRLLEMDSRLNLAQNFNQVSFTKSLLIAVVFNDPTIENPGPGAYNQL